MLRSDPRSLEGSLNKSDRRVDASAGNAANHACAAGQSQANRKGFERVGRVVIIFLAENDTAEHEGCQNFGHQHVEGDF